MRTVVTLVVIILAGVFLYPWVKELAHNIKAKFEALQKDRAAPPEQAPEKPEEE